ncbi:MAG: universal stress protein [Ilumatobacteraceae bacterium]
MYANIVVGTDGSDTARIAVAHAVALAQASGGTLHVVHAFQNVSLGMAAIAAGTGGPAVDLDRLNSGLQDNAERVIAEVVDECERGGVKVQSHIVSGEPADALVTVAEKVGADLVVVGNRGMSSMKRFMLGSVPNRISHHCPCSLLIVDTSKG